MPFTEFEQFLRGLPKRKIFTGAADPVEHVRNQFKESIAIFVDAFKDYTFRNLDQMEDAYELYAFDFVIDRNLDVWLHTALTDTSDMGVFQPFMREDYYFLLEKKHDVYYAMLKTLTEVWDKQEEGQNILPLTSIGSWELAVVNDWQYRYQGYVAAKRRTICTAHEGLRAGLE